MTRLLIVDDEANIREVVKEYAELNGYETDEAEDGLQALELVKQNDYDCVILDIMMPKLDGFSACKQIKKIRNVPVIMLSARQEEYDKLFGFELGVDDYVVKPFSPKELMARVKAVIERSSRTSTSSIMKFFDGGLVIDAGGRSVSVDGQKANLTPKEIDLLLYMVDHKNIALSRDKLLEEVWNYDYFGDDRTVDTHVKMLRHNLGRYRDCIVTVRGMGYKFET
ncbi:MAG: response regulator transcription factor [Bulleidia sp.]|nr:response regulator transcription factor [Bulleidia sp.]